MVTSEVGSEDRSVAQRVHLSDLLRALPAMVPDLPSMARGVFRSATLKPHSENSLGLVFQQRAAEHPQRPFLRFRDSEITYGNANEQVNRYAAVLAARGVRPGSVVGVLSTNRPETLLVAMAAIKLGATAGMLNHRQRGDVLNHSQKLLESTVIVAGAECQEALESLPAEELRGTVLGLREDGRPLPGHADLDTEAANASAQNPSQCAEVTAADKAFFIYTSGTTGMPKASTMSHLRWLKSMYALAGLGIRLRSDDTMYCCLPLYHNNALTVSLSAVLGAGATLAIGESFSVSRFWDDVVRTRSTAFCYIGELCRYLLQQPETAAEKQHRIRVVVGNGLRPDIWQEFRSRFGIERIAEFYGASECNVAFINAFNVDRTAGICPLAFSVVEYDLESERPTRDEKGRLRKVKPGGVGLLVTQVTDRSPFDGYTDADATERKLVRDGFKSGDVWFNTGDLVHNQGFRHVAFIDRLGDTFRWKGENVATTEVEAALGEDSAVEQSVVYGVPVPGTDGKAGMAAVKLEHAAEFDGPRLAKGLSDRLPSYAVPLFVRLVDQLEETSTFKSKKVELREQGHDRGRFDDPLYVLTSDGYVSAYDGYVDDVASGAVRV
ncbi:long-chain-acyl-CoA synthetase [Allosaccharopolyspora coralli]|uniref:long-chain-acyl-CoA synthetase n=1 Tax=Allosaccharopolyspora coralli TaxID=2665642 RepID=UPI001C9E9CDD|nr:long-chain-acyl-CoA synthetase [Allosaccharopolyspora coralli]